MNEGLISTLYTTSSFISVITLVLLLIIFRNEIIYRSLHEDIILKICIADIFTCSLYIIYSFIYYDELNESLINYL